MLITAFPAPARSLIMAVCLTVAGPGPLNSLQLLTGTQRSEAEMCLLTRGKVAIVQALFLIFLTDLGVVHFCALLFLGGDGEMKLSLCVQCRGWEVVFMGLCVFLKGVS